MQYNNSCFRPNEANGFLYFYLFCQLRRKCSFIGKDIVTNLPRGEILAPRRSPNLPFGSAECRTHRAISIIKNNFICGCGEIGRRAWFRFMWETMQVQVLSSAPQEGSLRVANKKSEKRLTLFYCPVLLRLSFFAFKRTVWNNVALRNGIATLTLRLTPCDKSVIRANEITH